MTKINPEEVERLLKYGAYAFLDDGDDEEADADENAAKSMKIDDILKNKKDKTSSKKGGNKSYTLQKTTFTTADMGQSKKDSGKNSAKKNADGTKQKLDVNDPNFWEKILPFDGFNPKQLNRKLRVKKAEILKTKET